jgi:hypothetical protein
MIHRLPWTTGHKLNMFPSRDTAAAVRLQEWPVWATTVDGDVIEGPVPLLFTTNIEEATAALCINPNKASTIYKRSSQSFSCRKTFRRMQQWPSWLTPELQRWPSHTEGPHPGQGTCGQARQKTDEPHSAPEASTSAKTTTGELSFQLKKINPRLIQSLSHK